MDIVILNKSEKPIYEQISEQIASQILNGALAPDQCLPSIRAMAGELGISVITVKKAFEMLEAGGLIYTRAGKGSYVAAHPPKALMDRKLEAAAAQLQKELPFYRSLHLSREELTELIRKLY